MGIRMGLVEVVSGARLLQTTVDQGGFGILLRDPRGPYKDHIKAMLGKPFWDTTLEVQPWNPGVEGAVCIVLVFRPCPSCKVRLSELGVSMEWGTPYRPQQIV